MPANGHDQTVTTKHESLEGLCVVIPACFLAGIQKKSHGYRLAPVWRVKLSYKVGVQWVVAIFWIPTCLEMTVGGPNSRNRRI